MTQFFNLIDEPWIPCETWDGEVTPLSLREMLANAHTLRGICGDSPLETAALYRLLLAVLHRVFGPATIDVWFELWRAGQWDTSALDAYWDQWYDRFDLLHPDERKRFYQQKPLDGKSTPILHLVHSTANNAALFSHITDLNYPALTPAQSARALLTAQAFRVGGLLRPGLSGPDGPSARGITFVMEGATLFETTLFNLWAYSSPHLSQTTGIPQDDADRPCWEFDDAIGSGRSLPLGYLDYLTWQTYRVWLEAPDEKGLISEIQIGLGQPKLAATVFDAFKHHRAIKKSSQNLSGYTPLRFSEDRVLWRDSAALLEVLDAQAEGANKRPMCVVWFNALYAEDMQGELEGYDHIPLVALGMASDQAKIEFYRQERMPIPSDYLRDPELVQSLKLGLGKAEEIRKGLFGALYRLAERMVAPDAGQAESRKPRREDVTPLIDHWNVESQYWAELDLAFWQFVEDLPKDGTAALVEWVGVLMGAARNSYAAAEALAGTDARALKASAAGRGVLEWNLAAIRKDIEAWQIE